MLPVSCRIAARSLSVSPWPNSFWNTARGLPSCGSDCVGVRQASRAPPSAVVNSSDGTRVSWPMCRAANWSALTPQSAPLTPWSHGFTHVSHVISM